MEMIGNLPFVEFDLSIDGFGCLFLPSVFPQKTKATLFVDGNHQGTHKV